MYRTIEVGIWQEMWFEELSPHGKLLFFYLLTNTRQTPCGAFRVSLRSICHETNLSADDARAAMADLVALDKAAWWPQSGWVFLTRFYRHQRAKGSHTYTVAARKAAAEAPDDVYGAITTLYPDLADETRGYAYPIPSLAIQETETVTATGPVTEAAEAPAGASAHEPDAPPAKEPRYSAEFLRLWSRFPRPGRVDKPGAYCEFKAQRPDADDLDAGLVRWEHSQRWADGYVVSLKRWLKERRWEDEPEPAGPARASPNDHSRPSKLDIIREGLGVPHDRGRADEGAGVVVRALAAPGGQFADGRGNAAALPRGIG